MPLRECCTDECISDNIRELVHAGHDQDQAVAIAMSKCNRTAQGWLWRWRMTRTRQPWFSDLDPLLGARAAAATDIAKKQAAFLQRQLDRLLELSVAWAEAADAWDRGHGDIERVRELRDLIDQARDPLIKQIEQL